MTLWPRWGRSSGKKTGDSEYRNFSVNFIDGAGLDGKQEIPFAYSLYYWKNTKFQTGFLKKKWKV